MPGCGLKDKYTKPVLAKASLHLHSFMSSPAFDDNFNYHSIVEKLNYLAQTTRPNIVCATHQIANTYIVCTIVASSSTQSKEGFDCFCDADFLGNWNKLLAPAYPSNAKSQTCPIIWASKLQSQVALTITEAEYIALSPSLCDAIPIIHFLE
ncbi:hypothetical protein ACHAXS_005251 [Conticribra weissflogii]